MSDRLSQRTSSEFNRESISVVLVGFVGLALSYAPVFNATLSIFMKDFGVEFGWDRTTTIGGQSAAQAAIFAVPLWGFLIDRAGPRRVIIFSTLIYGLSIAAMGTLGINYLLFLGLCFLVGTAGGSGAGVISYISLVSRWFDRRLGSAIGVVNMGIGLGAAIMPVLAESIRAAHGWRVGYYVLGGLILCVALPAAIAFAKDRPDRVELRKMAQPIPSAQGEERASVFRSSLFWATNIGNFLIMATVGAIAIHLFPMMTDRGFSPSSSATVLALLGGAVAASRLVAGVLLDFVPAWLLGTVIFLGVALGATLLALATSTVAIVAATILIGAGQGVEGDLLPYIVRRHFGFGKFAMTYGWMMMAYGAGAAAGPMLAAQVFDRTGSYQSAFVALALGSVVAALLMATFVRRGCQ